MTPTKGFITIATGKEQYYEIARNLLRSYRFTTKNTLPFALLCDTENEYTKEFDDVRIFENPTRSYLDKLNMFDLLPYDINIFIDADCLAFRDINRLFEEFSNADDFCCYGRVLPLDDKTGWFEYDNLKDDMKPQIDYVVGLHGGIYYMRKTDLCKKIFDSAKEFSKDYYSYGFKGKFTNPGDEPLIALSMAINKCKPIKHDSSAIFCYWECEDGVKLSFKNNSAYVVPENIYTDIVHWGTRFTKTPIYLKQISALNLLKENKSDFTLALSDLKYNIIIFYNRILNFAKRVCNKIKRILHI